MLGFWSLPFTCYVSQGCLGCVAPNCIRFSGLQWGFLLYPHSHSLCLFLYYYCFHIRLDASGNPTQSKKGHVFYVLALISWLNSVAELHAERGSEALRALRRRRCSPVARKASCAASPHHESPTRSLPPSPLPPFTPLSLSLFLVLRWSLSASPSLPVSLPFCLASPFFLRF